MTVKVGGVLARRCHRVDASKHIFCGTIELRVIHLIIGKVLGNRILRTRRQVHQDLLIYIALGVFSDMRGRG